MAYKPFLNPSFSSLIRYLTIEYVSPIHPAKKSLDIFLVCHHITATPSLLATSVWWALTWILTHYWKFALRGLRNTLFFNKSLPIYGVFLFWIELFLLANLPDIDCKNRRQLLTGMSALFIFSKLCQAIKRLLLYTFSKVCEEVKK